MGGGRGRLAAKRPSGAGGTLITVPPPPRTAVVDRAPRVPVARPGLWVLRSYWPSKYGKIRIKPQWRRPRPAGDGFFHAPADEVAAEIGEACIRRRINSSYLLLAQLGPRNKRVGHGDSALQFSQRPRPLATKAALLLLRLAHMLTAKSVCAADLASPTAAPALSRSGGDGDSKSGVSLPATATSPS